ncbi:unnamed protein product [Caenorhabditis angaria]|uniref:Syndetin C-terminal domain-containing protein n=1 Tax=Caenorhabditis angaria TaxID=860376 RepID=A0A9P1IIP8_9PELO|nr:unnamed protein product [Caenorhabditis angaria]
MDRFKEQITKTVQQLGESFSTDDDVKVLLEDMGDFVMSSYDEPSTSEVVNIPITPKTTPKKQKISDDEEIINSIDAAYFIDHDDFNAIDYELKKLCDVEMCYEDIQRERLRLKSQHTVVSKKISSLIMQKSPSYSGQIGEMDNIRKELSEVIKNVAEIRRGLLLSKSQTRTCLETLETVKDIYEAEQRIQEVIELGNFPLAIQMLIENQIKATSYAQFTCINDVMSKLAGLSVSIESGLLSKLSNISVIFDQEQYGFVFTAYEMLDKANDLILNLEDIFQKTIESTSRAIVIDKLKPENFEESTFLSLCMKLENDQIVQVFREMGFVICRTLFSYHSVIRFHSQEHLHEVSKEIKRILLENRQKLYLVAVTKIKTLIESRDFVALKFDQLLEIVDMINRFNAIGQQYFCHNSRELLDAVEVRISNYFEKYHRDRLDELIMFIENESFTLCPIPIQFTIFDLQDFDFLKEAKRAEEEELKEKEKVGEENDEEEDEEKFIMANDWLNPFSQAVIKSRHQSTYSQRSNRSLSTTSDNFDDPLDEPSSNLQPSPNLCNTALNLLRFFGRYIRMTALLPTISNKSAPAIIELFEFFFASICHIFATEGSEFVGKSQRLMNCLDNISKKISSKNSPSSPFKKVFRSKEDGVIYPSLCPTVQIAFIDNLYGACERIIGIDSIEFVAKQLDLIRPVIESLILEEFKEELLEKIDEFYSKVLVCCSDAKVLIIDTSASRSLRLKTLVENVSATKWDINELKSQHSPYVDLLIQDFEVFRLRLNALEEENPINVTENMKQLFWNRAIFYAFKALVQGYGDGGKCSTEGRALMQLDFQNILMKLENICGQKPVPHANFVDGYIKAYYLPENGLEQWIKNHSEYSSKQITSLLGAAAHVSKKAKIRILDALKE